MKTLILSIIFILGASMASAQDAKVPVSSDLDLPTLAIGLNVENFDFYSIFESEGPPPHKFLLTYNVLPALRIEGGLGISSYHQKTVDEGYGTYQSDYSATSLGISAMGMIQRGRTNLYGGIRYTQLKQHNEFKAKFDDPWYEDYNEEEDIKTISWGPIVGGEYFFGRHFSFAGEVGMNWNNVTIKDNDDEEMDYNQTYTRLAIRFYLL